MRGTFDWGVLDEKRTHPNTNIEGPKWDFNPPSVIMCHNRVGAVAYVGKVCLLKSKAAECTKEDPCKILAIGANSRPLRRIYSLVFRHRNRIRGPLRAWAVAKPRVSNYIKWAVLYSNLAAAHQGRGGCETVRKDKGSGKDPREGCLDLRKEGTR